MTKKRNLLSTNFSERNSRNYPKESRRLIKKARKLQKDLPYPNTRGNGTNYGKRIKTEYNLVQHFKSLKNYKMK